MEINTDYNVNLDNPKTRVRIEKRERGDDQMPRFEIWSRDGSMLIAGDLTLVQARRLVRERGWDLIIDE